MEKNEQVNKYFVILRGHTVDDVEGEHVFCLPFGPVTEQNIRFWLARNRFENLESSVDYWQDGRDNVYKLTAQEDSELVVRVVNEHPRDAVKHLVVVVSKWDVTKIKVVPAQFNGVSVLELPARGTL